MRPALRPGQLVLGYRWGQPREGQVVVAQSDRLLIKRVAKLDGDRIWLLGDNAQASTDSRQLGWLPLAVVEAVIVARSPYNR